MRIINVNPEYVKAHLTDIDTFRLTLCDDSKGESNKPHYAMRVRAVNTLQVEDLMTSCDNMMCAFVKVEFDD